MPISPIHVLNVVSPEYWTDAPTLAVVQYTPARCRQILRRMDEVGRMSAQEGAIEVRYRDDDVLFSCAFPEGWEDEESVTQDVVERAVNRAEDVLVSPEASDELRFLPGVPGLDTSLIVRPDMCRWYAPDMNSGAETWSTWALRKDLLRALYLSVPDAELEEVLRLYGHEVPEMALDLLDPGLMLEGHPGVTRKAGRLPEELLLAMLEHPAGPIRQRAITQLERIKKPPRGRKR